MGISNITERIRRGFERRAIALSSDSRPSSYPYISGDGFRALASHIFEKENISSFDAQTVQEGDIVFVESDLVHDFFARIHTHIQHPYLLITHNGDTNIDETAAHYADEKIVHWFAQNCLVEHPKITPLPIGLENAYLANAGKISLFDSIRKAPMPEKNGRILVGFSSRSNPVEREKALTELSRNPYADVISSALTQKQYIEMLAHYSYVASPPGNGEDCHRTWEALYVGTIPMVKPSVATRSFAKLGIPLAIITSWTELPVETQNIDSNTPQLFMDYWIGRITEARNNIQ